MKTENPIITDLMEWQGIVLSVSYQSEYLGMEGMAHLTIQVRGTKHYSLPITGTGYRSHFESEAEIAERGGPLAYVRAWLDAEAAKPEWLEQDPKNRQLSLF
ncbi:MAG TPA: hypothetical protein VII56_12365 [Rhizomicrobium sp.]